MTIKTEEIPTQMSRLSSKLRGLAYLFSHIELESQKDSEAFSGLAELLHELAEQGAEIKAAIESRLPASGIEKNRKSVRSAATGFREPKIVEDSHSEPTSGPSLSP